MSEVAPINSRLEKRLRSYRRVGALIYAVLLIFPSVLANGLGTFFIPRNLEKVYQDALPDIPLPFLIRTLLTYSWVFIGFDLLCLVLTYQLLQRIHTYPRVFQFLLAILCLSWAISIIEMVVLARELNHPVYGFL